MVWRVALEPMMVARVTVTVTVAGAGSRFVRLRSANKG